MLSKLVRCLLIGLGLFLANPIHAAGSPPNLAEIQSSQNDDDNWVYSTNGVHSDHGCDETPNNCIAPRNGSDPADPRFPEYWISDWTMFTVLNETASAVNPPPYSNPPITLLPDDYRVSYGTSYYDNSYKPENPGDEEDYGAMLEYYNDFCLPIFGKTLQGNSETCAFASLGNNAFFLEFDDKHPDAAPSCCQFSPKNHPPRPDFLKHLDYWPDASTRLNSSVQAYYWKKLWEPDANPRILFAYAFNKETSPQGQMPQQSAWYQHPQSFFFSGRITLVEGNPAEQQMPVIIEPIISQNYTSFRVEKPDPRIWENVAQWCPLETIKKCHLFPGQ